MTNKEYQPAKKDLYGRTYLGDGVYGEFDGYGVWLRTYESPSSTDYANEIYIEPTAFVALEDYLNKMHSGQKER